MEQLINNIQLASGVQLYKSELDQGFSLNSEEITGDHIYFIKTRIYKCFKYTSTRSKNDSFYWECRENYKGCKGRIAYMTFKKSQDLTNNFKETQPHTCKTNGLIKIFVY
ncbi:unnamed protein product [Meloidogyne enterolobii]|uniref:Uncharacterized protein n=2 Tax=Meloidogyne enterolobii TaxID=390850 RepID=A0ACB0Z4L6_MELEN|nr:unnamed protein product [Meloidogyne enterolobii]